MAKQRRYSDEDRANALAALAANGGNLGRTARELGIPRATLGEWAKGTSHPEAAENSAPKKKVLADAIEGVAWKLVEAMPDKIATAALSQLAVCLGIAVEKMRLLREQTTSNPGDGIPDDERTARINQLLDAARARRAQQADGGRAA